MSLHETGIRDAERTVAAAKALETEARDAYH
jgi:hypothetical protein